MALTSFSKSAFVTVVVHARLTPAVVLGAGGHRFFKVITGAVGATVAVFAGGVGFGCCCGFCAGGGVCCWGLGPGGVCEGCCCGLITGGACGCCAGAGWVAGAGCCVGGV